MRLSTDLVAYVSDLAHLRLNMTDVERIANELGRVLDYVEVLQAVDTSAVDATWQGSRGPGGMRSDEAGPSLDPLVALANAPAAQNGMFRIPRILAEGEDQ
ncbi:MAG: Asp-tRNA(Asn)/Glu-tRNA(Gln) amidotransferase subunit GatC [Firmicutes bacterium]|nr:Asp-tRNA(Asn)/Glu-tRNA(Gln) amidotransferase subunit GatC [Bacillota bacterium]MCL5064478.1 Asp-tRNA(Asn)/Glu-tRNA(Gln) amidotransferase subunit GatC [Bacillota bacterium]